MGQSRSAFWEGTGNYRSNPSDKADACSPGRNSHFRVGEIRINVLGGQARRTSNSCAENRFSPVRRDQVTTVLTLRAKRTGTGTVTVRNPQPFAEVLRSPFALSEQNACDRSHLRAPIFMPAFGRRASSPLAGHGTVDWRELVPADVSMKLQVCIYVYSMQRNFKPDPVCTCHSSRKRTAIK
jgi:hypothetical protein